MSAPASAARAPIRPRTHGPVQLCLEIVFGLLFMALFSWLVRLAIEIVGSYTLWKEQGTRHAQRMVQQDMDYIAAAPRSLLVDDTAAFARRLCGWIARPYERLGVPSWHARLDPAPGSPEEAALAASLGASKGTARAARAIGRHLSRWALSSMYVAQDVALRLSVALFALPAFALACLVGVVDGLVRRDLRRWQGGRESSFVYHHAKRYTVWALTGGFSLYLTWPFGGFNPAYMVLVFTVLVAATLSTTVAAFKKYV